MMAGLFAIVPVKPFAEAKQRLADVLSAEARLELARDLFTHTLGVVARAQGIGRVAVISRDEHALALARERGAWAMWESSTGLNRALEQATRVAVANGAGALLVIPADLPRLTISEIEHLIALGQHSPCMVISPAQRDGGTNALLLNPPGLIRYAFGERSFSEHLGRAAQAGARIEVYDSEGLSFDLDAPEDVALLDHEVTRTWVS